MKKLLITFLVFLIAASSLAGKPPKTKSFAIQGGYGKVTDIIVEPIPSQTQAYLIGMPFNIEDKQVQYGATESGRMIANWSMLTNTPGQVKLTVSAGKLKHDTMESTELDYELRFFYRLGYYDVNGDLVDAGDSKALVYSTENESASFTLFSSDIEEGSYIGSIDGSIYFMFTQESSLEIRPEDGSTANYTKIGDEPFFPGGEYSAEVTLTLEVGE